MIISFLAGALIFGFAGFYVAYRRYNTFLPIVRYSDANEHLMRLDLPESRRDLQKLAAFNFRSEEIVDPDEQQDHNQAARDISRLQQTRAVPSSQPPPAPRSLRNRLDKQGSFDFRFHNFARTGTSDNDKKLISLRLSQFWSSMRFGSFSRGDLLNKTLSRSRGATTCTEMSADGATALETQQSRIEKKTSILHSLTNSKFEAVETIEDQGENDSQKLHGAPAARKKEQAESSGMLGSKSSRSRKGFLPAVSPLSSNRSTSAESDKHFDKSHLTNIPMQTAITGSSEAIEEPNSNAEKKAREEEQEATPRKGTVNELKDIKKPVEIRSRGESLNF